MCVGQGCKLHFDRVVFEKCTLVVVGGAEVILSGCDFTASCEQGTGLCLMVSGQGSLVRSQERCVFKGGLQCIAVHAGASFYGRSVHCSDAAVTGIEVLGFGSVLKLSRGRAMWAGHVRQDSSCKISNVHMHRQKHTDWWTDCGFGLLMHKGTVTDVMDTDVTQCYVGMLVTCRDILSVNEASEVGSTENVPTNLNAKSVLVNECWRECILVVSAPGLTCDLVDCLAKGGMSGVKVCCSGGVVNLTYGSVSCNRQHGVLVSKGAVARVERMTSSGNNAGYASLNDGSLLELIDCSSYSDKESYKQSEGGLIQLTASPVPNNSDSLDDSLTSLVACDDSKRTHKLTTTMKHQKIHKADTPPVVASEAKRDPYASSDEPTSSSTDAIAGPNYILVQPDDASDAVGSYDDASDAEGSYNYVEAAATVQDSLQELKDISSMLGAMRKHASSELRACVPCLLCFGFLIYYCFLQNIMI